MRSHQACVHFIISDLFAGTYRRKENFKKNPACIIIMHMTTNLAASDAAVQAYLMS